MTGQDSDARRSTTLGALLAGGGSRRMGEDKAGLAWRAGLTLGEAVESALLDACDRVVVLGHGAGLPPRSGRLRLEDAEAGGGPLQAMATLLESGLAEVYVIAPCDMPGLTAAVLRALARGAEGQGLDGAGLVRAEGSLAVLPLSLRASAAPKVRALVDRGVRRVGQLRTELALARVHADDVVDTLRNINTPADYAAEVAPGVAGEPDADVTVSPGRATRAGGAPASGAPIRTAPTRGAPATLAPRAATPNDRAPSGDQAKQVAARRLGESATDEWVATEAPLQILLGPAPLAVLMRTPGHDAELVTGFLLNEGIVARAQDLADVAPCDDVELAAARGHVVRATLRPGVAVDVARLARNTYVGSSCGICGQASIERALAVAGPVDEHLTVSDAVLRTLPDALRRAQRTFQLTGGLHGVALFDEHGRLHVVREDVGRHNAVDKVLGWLARQQLADPTQPLRAQDLGLFVSGRISFEVVQKALAARVGVVAGVSAPTSLAVELSHASGVALYGFVRAGRATRYGG